MAKETKKEKSTTVVEHSQTTGERDELVDSLAEILNKDFKDLGKIIDVDGEDTSDVTDWVSTGSSLLDLAISNRPNGGIPSGRITELTGLEASGKSLIAAHALADTQKKGGLAVLIDTEHAVSEDFLEAIGVDLHKNFMKTNKLDTVEDIFDFMETIICNIRKKEKSKLVTIVVDSLAAASTKDELEDDYTLTGFATKKAIILSKAFRKITNLIGKQRICVIFTNQLREKVGVMTIGSLNKYTTPGGKALGFYSSVRIRLEPAGQIKDSNKETIGIMTKATVYKNRMGPPYRKVIFNLFFDRGISDYDSWIEWMVEKGLLKNAKSAEDVIKKKKDDVQEKIKCFSFIMSTGEKVVFERKSFAELISKRPEVKDEMYKTICDEFIMKYKDRNSELVDDAEISDDTIED